MIEQGIQGATIALGLLSWWSCVCRIAMMHPKTHKAEAIWWHAGTMMIALAVCGMAVWKPGDQLSLWTAGSIWLVLWHTWHEWADGTAPEWTLRRDRAPAQEGRAAPR